MVTQFGFSPKIGQVNFSNMGDGGSKPFSDATGKEIDAEVKRIIDEQWARTIDLVTEKKDLLHNLANVLLEKETIERDDLIEILGKRPFEEMTTYEEYVAGTKTEGAEIKTKTPEDAMPSKDNSKEDKDEPPT